MARFSTSKCGNKISVVGGRVEKTESANPRKLKKSAWEKVGGKRQKSVAFLIFYVTTITNVPKCHY